MVYGLPRRLPHLRHPTQQTSKLNDPPLPPPPPSGPHLRSEPATIFFEVLGFWESDRISADDSATRLIRQRFSQ